MLTMRFPCVGADGNRQEFVCVVTTAVNVFDLMKWPPDRRRHWWYRVYESEKEWRAQGACYYAEFVALDDGRVISRDMQAPDHLRALGIPDAVILDMAREHVVVSSSSKDVELLRGESQTDDARKVWRRLAGKDLARKIGVDRYEVVAPRAGNSR